ncbi:MAG: SidA/IucD/PvdA family monooxygenase [Actinobacteria bacterium]|nr:SidA/IucD/PvdA family monooxygenase [Actinomycetota bacterium]
MRPQHERVETVVIGGGQAGLAVGYHLARRDLPFVILDANERIGDARRKRWDSLRVFTPARFNGLPGMPFPGARHSFPTKDEVADYLEAYAARFELPVRTSTKVHRVSRNGGFEVWAGDHVWRADNVVVAMGTHQVPWIPPFAGELDPGIVQLDAGNYRNPDQLQPGPTLVVGAGSSGAEIALDVAPTHQTWLSGRHPGHVPFRIESRLGRVLVPVIIGFAFHKVVTVRTPIGRKVRPKLLSEGKAWIRAKPKALAAAGIERVPRVVGVQDGLPVLEDGRVLEVSNVVWCTGFRPDFSWIDLDVFGTGGNPIEPVHERGVIHSEPGLYFVGLFFLYAGSSELLRGVGRDAEYVVEHIAKTRTGAARESSRGIGVTQV